MDLKEKIKQLPDSPGVYMMKDDNGFILYIGKAGNIRKRVSSYFYPNRKLNQRLEAMVGKVNDISYISTFTEAEALIYENSLIKKLSPKYNVALKDGKTYPQLKLTLNEKFPRLFITRQRKKDGAAYFGPYADARLLRDAVKILRQVFPLRSCTKLAKRLCLEYHIKQCLGPCVGKIDEKNYAEIVSELKLFLEGKREELLKRLSEKMRESAGREDFEEAARIKNRIEALASIREKTVRYNPLDETFELKNIVGVKGPLDTIEAFDVSNIMGEEAVGSVISFYKGRPKKCDYRRFRIKAVSGIDDYAMMRELVRRRYERLIKEKRGLPDLVVVDGGKGHLSVAIGELEKLGLMSLPAIGIAKPARREDGFGRSGGEFEHVYLKGKADPVILPEGSKALHLLERIRDEAHRFALSYHKKLLSRKVRVSELDAISGIGPKRKKALMNRFGSIDDIRKAGIPEILKVKGMNEKAARNIVEYFKK